MKKLQFIQVTPEELQEAIINGVNSKITDLKEHLSLNKQEEYLTRDEVSKMFKINLSSVHNWTKKGKITGYGFPGSRKIYYKKSELENLLIQIKN